MRVLHVNSGNMYGGVESLLVTLADRRHLGAPMEPHFAACFSGRFSEALKGTGAEVSLLGDVQVRRPWTVWRARGVLRLLLKERPFDAVICHAAWVQAIFGPVVRAARVPLVFWLHDPPGPRLHWLEYWARLTPPDLALCNSRYTLGILPRLYPHVRGELVYCPVAPPRALTPEERLAAREEFGVPQGDVVIVQLGRWASHKGHLHHLEALGRLRDVPGWLSWQVGAPQGTREQEYFRSVKETAARLGIGDRVRFLGWQPDLARVLGAADIYCQPNTLPEPFGIAVIEALGVGLPVVATDLGGPREVVRDDCGILVPPGDAEALASALSRLVREPGLRAALGAAGPQRARILCDPATQIRLLADVLAGSGAFHKAM
jgi:glycosyltransferase involved in cell wall biosynthesis